jgi:hypothetical protein
MKLPDFVKTRRFRIQTLVALGVISAIVIYFLVNLTIDNLRRRTAIDWGVTFSTKYAKELGYQGPDWQKMFTAMLDDLGVRRFRIPVYWDEIQPKPGPYDFREVDWMMNEANKRGAKVILAIGRRVPRWPECHAPQWVSQQGLKAEDKQLLALVAAEAEHFKGAPALEYWQLENEPLLDVFGHCPPSSPDLLSEERRVLKAMDTTHPIVITDSGELSLWLRTALRADVLGISMYRVTWSKTLGYFFYPITPAYYWRKADALYPIVKDVIVTELQAEPWPANQRSVADTPIPEQYRSMSVSTFRDNIEFVRRVGFSEVYLWGAEWWYWIKDRGNPDFWNQAKALFDENRAPAP